MATSHDVVSIFEALLEAARGRDGGGGHPPDFRAEEALERVAQNIILAKWPPPPFGSMQILSEHVERARTLAEGPMVMRYGGGQRGGGNRRDNRIAKSEDIAFIENRLWEGLRSREVGRFLRKHGLERLLAQEETRCSVCRHPRRVEIEARLQAGESYRHIEKWTQAERCAASKDAIRRHSAHASTARLSAAQVAAECAIKCDG